MTTEIRTYKSNNSGLLIALAVSAVIAIALAFYLTTTGHKQDEVAQTTPAAVSTVAEAGQATPAAP